MLLEEKIYARLETTAENIYPLKAPLAYKLPATVFNVLTDVPVRDISDDEQTASFATIQIDVYSTDLLESMKLARTIRRDFLEWDEDGVQVLACANRQKSIDDTSEVDLYRTMMFFTLFVREDAD